jgi:hypothetical protein
MDKFKIFLSHKSQDKILARGLQKILEEPCGNSLDVYLMAEIPAGSNWLDSIKNALASSHMLLLLFTDETLEWDWCLYEAGLFTGLSDAQFHKVICIHDPQTPEPKQLAHLQTVRAEVEPVKQFLKGLYLETDTKWGFREKLAPKVDRDDFDQLNSLTKRVVELLSHRTPVEDDPFGKQMEVEIESAAAAVESNDTSVSGPALELFGLHGLPSWKDLRKYCEDIHQTEWLDELGGAITWARSRIHIPRPVKERYYLPHDANQRGYRPCLYRRQLMRTGRLRFSILFSEEPSLTIDRGVAEAITSFVDLVDRIVDLIGSAARNGSRIRFLALTPALGYLAKSQSVWDKLEKQIRANRDRIDMVSQTASDLSLWHAAFNGRQTDRHDDDNRGVINEKLIDAANGVSASVIRDLDPDHYHELPWRAMPSFYLFSSRDRAIVVTPFHLPRLGQSQGSASFSNVEMFGSVTNDPKIVRQVHDMHDYYVQEARIFAQRKAKGAASG